MSSPRSRNPSGFIPRLTKRDVFIDEVSVSSLPLSIPGRVTANGVVPTTRDAREMPECWRTPVKPIPKFFFTVLCLGALGQWQMSKLWESCRDEESFRARKERLSDRVTTVTVVAGLILGSMAAFVTTTPPLPDVMNYNIRGPYILLFTAMSITLGGLVVGSAIIYALSEMGRVWFIDTLMMSRQNVCCFLVLISYPFCAIGASTSIAVMGLLVAAWLSQDKLIQIGAIFCVLVPGSMGPIFIWSIRYSRPRILAMKEREAAQRAAREAGSPAEEKEEV